MIYFDEADHRLLFGIPLPFYIPTTEIKFVAPYFAEANFGAFGEVFYRQTSDPSLLSRATKEIRAAFPLYENVTMKSLLIATWYRVGFFRIFSRKSDKVSALLRTPLCKCISFLSPMWLNNAVVLLYCSVIEGRHQIYISELSQHFKITVLRLYLQLANF